MIYPGSMPDSKYLLIPAAKSLFLRDIWAVDTVNGAVVSIFCLRCTTYPTIYTFYDPDVYESRCECESRFVFASDITKHAKVDLEVVTWYLNSQYFNLTKSPAVQDKFLTWLAVHTGFDINRLSLDLS